LLKFDHISKKKKAPFRDTSQGIGIQCGIHVGKYAISREKFREDNEFHHHKF